MARVITFSRTFPSYHPRAGEPTYFVEQFMNWFWDQPQAKYHNVADMLCELNCDKWDEKSMIDFADKLDRDIQGYKSHTIRSGDRWSVDEFFSPRVWSGQPYNSKQIILTPDIRIGKLWDFAIVTGSIYLGKWMMDGEIESHHEALELLAANDGLTKDDLLQWFKYPKAFQGQIISWSDAINY